MTDFKKFNLSATILHSLAKKGYLKPTPIQSEAIPHLLLKRDLLGIAQTGTGKTAAFALPILDNLFNSKNPLKPNHARALILTPTRELASQIADNIAIYGQELHLKHTVIFGGVGENSQIRAMSKGVDILIATPGRLLDLMNQGYIKFANLEVFVLDEADRMLDMGFINDVKKIIAKLPVKRQTLFFSATMPQDIASLAQLILKDPVTIEVTPQATTVEKIDQRIHFVDQANKKLLLKSIVIKEEVKSVLVFSRTKHGANKVVDYLAQESITVAAIHGNKSQTAREKALSNFRQGAIKVLVATDIAARGIDISGITHVINYDLPNDPESYVHRIGRTARAGKEGIAISFCDQSERKLLNAIEKLIKISVPVDRTHPYQGIATKRVAKSLDHEKNDDQQFQKPRSSGDYSRSNEDRRRGNFGGGNVSRGRKPTSPAPTGKKEFFRDREDGDRRFNSSPARRSRPDPLVSGLGSEYSRPRFGDNKNRFDNKDSRREKPRFANSRENSYFRSENPGNSGSRFNKEQPRGERFNQEQPRGERFGFGSGEKKRDYSRASDNNKSYSRGFGSKGSRPTNSSRPAFGNKNNRPGGRKPAN